MRAAKRLSRERPVTTSSRKTPAPVAGAGGNADDDRRDEADLCQDVERAREVVGAARPSCLPGSAACRTAMTA